MANEIRVSRKLTKTQPPVKSQPPAKSETFSEENVNTNERRAPCKLTKRLPVAKGGLVLEEEINSENSEKTLSVFGLFQYASQLDRALQLTGCLACIIAGTIMASQSFKLTRTPAKHVITNYPHSPS
jgi:hypothetical protein